MPLDAITNIRYSDYMNERIIKIIKDSGQSQYQICKAAGIPFSTLNGIMNKKHAVNKCSAQTLLQIAEVLKTDVRKLLDPYPVMDGVEGRHKGIHYTWKSIDGKMSLHMENRTLDTEYKMNLPEQFWAYRSITEFIIEDYIDECDFARKYEAETE